MVSLGDDASRDEVQHTLLEIFLRDSRGSTHQLTSIQDLRFGFTLEVLLLFLLLEHDLSQRSFL